MKYVQIIIGFLLVLYVAIINKISSTKVAFSTPFLVLGVALIIYGFTGIRLKENMYFKKFNKILKIILVMGLVCFAIIEAVIVFYPKRSMENTDYIIVLGAGVNGKTPSLILQGRLDAAVECYNSGSVSEKIIVSGGQGNNEDISEAEAMKEYLINKGIPESEIVMENKSTNTNENFKFSKNIIEKLSSKNIDESSVKIITTDFHGFRSSIIAKNNGYNDVKLYTSDTVYYLIPVCYTREAFAIVKTIIF